VTVSIIGDTGFIGRQLSIALSQLSIPTIGFNSEIPFFNSEGNLDERLVNSSCIFWAAGRLNPVTAKNDPELVRYEIELWTNFIEKLRNKSHSPLNPRIIFLSSGGCVYDVAEIPIDENSPANGSNEYGRAKVEMERILLKSGISSMILRVSNVYGPGQRPGRGQGVIAEWLNAIKNHSPIKVFGNTSSSRDYLHISDLIDALRLCMGSSYEGILNLGSGTTTTLEEILECFKFACGSDLNILYQDVRATDKSRYALNVLKAEEVLGWKPSIDIRKGIIELVGVRRDAN
jgi:UDP-glucose 4-epimerase